MSAANGIISKLMSKEITPEVQEYIDRLVSISREMTRFVGIDHAALDTSGHALKAAEVLTSLSLKGCLNENIIQYFWVGNPGDTMDNEIYLRTLSIKIKD